MASPGPVVVVGAGVSGLTTALVLAERGVPVRVVAAAPSGRTTSAVPAALWYPYRAEPRPRVLHWARRSHARFRALAADPATGVVWREGLELFRSPVPDPWWRDAVTGFRRARPDEIGPTMRDGVVFEAPVVETPVYLPWLAGRLAAAGIAVEQACLGALADAVGPGGVVVDAAGLGARELVPDRELFASRGQLVHVEPVAGLTRFVLDEADPARITYVVPRRDAVVLGGTVEDGVESLEPDERSTALVLERARALVPEIARARVLRAVVGLRPCRREVRLGVERLPGGRVAVHNYGHGGAGFTLSWGCAEEAADRVAGALA